MIHIKINKILFVYSLIILMALCSTSMLYAQKHNEVSIALKGGFSKLRYDSFQNTTGTENTYSFELGYRHYLNERWSLGTGAEFQELRGRVSSGLIQDSYAATDMDGENFEFRYTIRDYSEEQQLHLINVPVNLQYETGGITRFYAAAGASLGFVVESQYENRAHNINSSGYYEQYNAILNAPAFAGFGSFTSQGNSGSDLDVKTNIILNLETGAKVFLEGSHALYVGLFFDYGLTNLKEQTEGQDLLIYGDQSSNNLELNTMFKAVNRTSGVAYLEDLKTLSYGLKLRYALRF